MKDKISKVFHNKLIKNSLVYIATDSINKAIPFLLLPVITTYLIPAEFGIVNNFLVFSSVLMILIGINIDGAVSANYYKLNKQELKSYVSSVLGIITVAFILVSILILIFQNVIHDYTKIPLAYQLLTSVLSYFYMITTVNLAFWRLDEKALKFGIYQIMQTAVNLGLSLYFIIVLGTGWKGRADGYIIACVLFGLISFIILYRENLIGKHINRKFVKDALVFGVPLIPHALSSWIRSGIDRIFITKYLGETMNGIYATGFQLGVLMTFLTIAFNNAFVPFLFKKLSNPDQQELEASKKRLVKMSYAVILILLILCIVLSAASYFLIEYFLPASYKDAQVFVFWAILAQTFQGMYYLVGNYVFYAKKTKFFAVITFSCALLQVALTYFLIKPYGALGAAYAAVAVSILNFVAVWIYSNKVYPMPWFLNFRNEK